ncbi:MAG: YifB family Mg chelatase-like AAA ATPase [Bacteroidales bacterium]|nr:YifB family Mg chelatase-like AAA ATPase [Bacteroidales bacterium]
MLVNINGAKCVGIDAMHITIEIDVSIGIGFHLVGLGDVAVKESLLRVTTAMTTLGYKIPGKKIVINLAPADTHKQGSGFDLPIAAGVLLATEQLDVSEEEAKNIASNCLLMGELGLDGSVRQISGALPMLSLARSLGLKEFILPRENALEIQDYAEGLRVYGVESLPDVVEILTKKDGYEKFNIDSFAKEAQKERPDPSLGFPELTLAGVMDMSEIIGQNQAKRGIEIAASGGHNIILIGSPGSGKSSLAKAMCGILPPLSPEENLVTRKIYSVAGIRQPMNSMRPFRSPHYSASLASIIGGGSSSVAPGEISLAHNGILFIDEFCEASKQVIEALRAPMEDGKVTISRLKAKIDYPARFTLVAATNPCPCGYYGEGNRCKCTRTRREQYLNRLSGPLLDRIDLQIWVHPVDPKKLSKKAPGGETSAEIARRVRKVREIQRMRFAEEGINCNAEMSNSQIGRFCNMTNAARETLDGIMEKMKLSVRAYYRIQKLSQTIADIEAVRRSEAEAVKRGDLNPNEILVEPQHILEAASYRLIDGQP